MSQPANDLPPELIGLDFPADINSPVSAKSERYVFKGMIPKLGPSHPGEKFPALLKNGGQPGVFYAQFPVQLVKAAEDSGWSQVSGSNGRTLAVYTIEGPLGRVDCMLLAKGRPIPGTAPNSNKRVCRVHKEIKRITGLGLSLEEATQPAASTETIVDDKPNAQRAKKASA